MKNGPVIRTKVEPAWLELDPNTSGVLEQVVNILRLQVTKWHEPHRPDRQLSSLSWSGIVPSPL